MTEVDRKALTRAYKETPREAGIYRVRNTATGRSLVGASPNLPGILNRHRFALEMGSHQSKQLQADWNELGPDAFAFEVLDRLEAPDDPAWDPAEDLAVLKALWLDKMAESDTELYRELG